MSMIKGDSRDEALLISPVRNSNNDDHKSIASSFDSMNFNSYFPDAGDLDDMDDIEPVAEPDHIHCLVCYSELEYIGITPCDHNDICGVCHLRLRQLHKDTGCTICKTTNDKIIVDKNIPGISYDEYPIWGNELGSKYVYRDDVGMFFLSDYYYETIEPLFGFSCNVGDCKYDPATLMPATCVPTENDNNDGTDRGGSENDNNDDSAGGNDNNNTNSNENGNNKNKNKKKKQTPIRMLQDHLRGKHKLALCQLCVDNKRDFVVRLQRYTPNQLKLHLNKGDGPGSGFEGHPLCEFCRPKRFYDLTHLHQHLNKEHYKCHVCEKQGLPNQFFKNYKALEKHFDKQHFLCHDVTCLQARFVVFENELDLHVHERDVHGASSGSSKIQLEFRVRRPGQQERQDVPSDSDFNYGLDGEAFVPADLPTSQHDSVHRLHPLHIQRTEQLRAQAAQIRQQNEPEVESFPALGAPTGANNDQQQQQTRSGQQNSFGGWTTGTTLKKVSTSSKKAGKVTDEDFPSLPTLGKKKKKYPGVSTNRGAASSKQFSAMNSMASIAATQPRAAAPSVGNFFAATGAPAQNRQANLTQDNFPALGGGARKPPAMTQNNFPTLGGGSNRAAASAVRKPSGLTMALASAPPIVSKPPAMTQNNFPSLGPSQGPALTQNNFPSLGGGGGGLKKGKKKGANVAAKPPVRYTAAEALAKKLAANQAQSFAHAEDVPSWNSTKSAPIPIPQSVAPPPIASNDHFPSMAPAAAAKNSNSVRNKMFSQQAQPNQVLPSPAPSTNAKEMIKNMQVYLGVNKYKQLKKYTKEFAQGNLSPEGFIDSSVVLFDGGYDNPNFWLFIPSLLLSCPDEGQSNAALRYMERQKHKSSSSGSNNNNSASGLSALRNTAAPPPAKSAWGAGGGGGGGAKKAPPTAGQQGGKKNKKKQSTELKSLAYGR